MSPAVIPTDFCRTCATLLLALAAVQAVFPAWADEADDSFAVATGHYAVKRWHLAAEEFQTFLERYPNHSKADRCTFLLAEAMLQLGNYEQASTGFRQYLEGEPNGEFARPALFRAGEAAYMAGKFDSAKTFLMRFRSQHPDDKLNAFVLTYLGDIAMGEDAPAAAAGHFRRGLEQFPDGRLQDDCRFGLARALEKQNQNQQAEQLYRAVAAKPQNPLADDAQFHLAVLQYTMGKHAEAVETFSAFETSLVKSPWRAKARLGRGWALMKLDRLDEAETMFRSIVNVAQVALDARYWLGMVQREQEDWAAAAKTLMDTAEAAKAADPGDSRIPVLHFYAGDALRRAGELKTAVEQFGLVLECEAAGNDWTDDALLGKTLAALEADDHQGVDQAAAEFSKRCPYSPLRADLRRALARSQLKRNDHARVVKLLEPLVAFDRLNEQSNEQSAVDCYLLARAYEGLRDYRSALAVLMPVLDSADPQLLADAQLLQGSLLVATGRYDQAVKPLEAFSATGPAGDAEVKCRGELAICYARTGHLDKAKRLYAELLAGHSGHKMLAIVTEQLAEAAYAADDQQWAADLFNQVRTSEVSNETELRGLAGLGWSRFRAGKLEEAAATFNQLLAKDPPAAMAADAALVRGQILQQLDKPDPALLMYDLVIEKYPSQAQHPRALLAAARLRVELEQLRQAASLYEQLVRQYPDVPRLESVLYEWAWVLNDLGKTAEAVALFERLRKQHADTQYGADATFRLARRALAAKDYDRAEELTAEVLAGSPDEKIREHALHLRGQIAVARQKWDQVAEHFSALLESFPETSGKLVAAFWIAEAAYRRNDYESAGRKFDRLAEEIRGSDEPWLAAVPLRRAQVLAQQDKWTEAYAIASKIAARFPHFKQQYEVDYLIGRCLHSRADFQGARDAFRKVIRSETGEKTETAAMAQWMIGETFFHQKNYEAALREYLRLEILYAYPTWQAAALLQAGKCHECLGQRSEAVELYRRLLKLYPDTPFAQQADKRLKTPPGKQAGSRPAESLTPEVRSIRRR